MRWWLVLVLAPALGCTRQPKREASPPPTRAPSPRASEAPAPPAPAPARCLPVVAKECGCVYDCGVGKPNGDGTYTVSHQFWKDTPLRARIDRWCVDQQCTEVFAAEIVCDGTCPPRPADPGCAFHGDTCSGTPP